MNICAITMQRTYCMSLSALLPATCFVVISEILVTSANDQTTQFPKCHLHNSLYALLTYQYRIRKSALYVIKTQTWGNEIRLLARPTTHAVCPSVCLAREITEYKKTGSSDIFLQLLHFPSFTVDNDSYVLLLPLSLFLFFLLFFFFLFYYFFLFFFFSDGTTVLLTGTFPSQLRFFWHLYPICNFTFINIHIQFQNLFYGRPLGRRSWRLLLNPWLTFLLLPIVLTRPIQFNRLILTNESISKSPNSCVNSLLYHLLQFSFTLIPPNILLRTFLSNAASCLAIPVLSVQSTRFCCIRCHWSC